MALHLNLNTRVTLMFLLIAVGLTACNMPQESQTPDAAEKLTQIYQTIEFRLTEAATLTPITTQPTSPTSDVQPTVTTTPLASPLVVTQAPTVPPASPTSSLPCDLAAPGNPIDVTIPDDTLMLPGQSFTKVWRLQNVGTCTWTRSYAVTYFSGEQMGAAASINLAGDVRPGQNVDIAVNMVAPSSAGKYQGNWKLRNASNVLFGIGSNGGAAFWVRIVVAQTPTPTSTQPTPTSTITPTPPPAVKVSGPANLALNNSLDLDSIQLISGVGGDIAYQVNEGGQHMLVPQGSALIGIYGATQPALTNCQATAVGASPVIVESLSAGSYLCYRTDQNSPGRLLIGSINGTDFTLALDIVTWATP